MTSNVEQAAPARRRLTFAPGVILVLGIVVVPMMIGLLVTWAWGAEADTPGEYVRVYFGNIVMSTVAACTAVGVLIAGIVRRAGTWSLVVFAVVAFVVVSQLVMSLGSQADQLVGLLGLNG